MQLKDLLKGLPDYKIQGSLDKEIIQITNHTNQVCRGTLFICIPGLKVDGHSFSSAAIAKGAEAIVAERDLDIDCTKILVKDAREAQALLSHTFNGNPSDQIEIIGVTGTNGKTTTTYFIESILDEFGLNPGRIGTINYCYQNNIFPSRQTTPDSIYLNKMLAEMVKAGTKSVVMEVSSHGLSQKRVDACNFDVAVLTNVTHDHFDYHSNIEHYLQAKVKLFEQLAKGSKNAPKFGVINVDDPNHSYFMQRCNALIITYGIQNKADVRAENIDLKSDGCSFDLVVGPYIIHFSLQIPGLFNIYNALASIAYAWGRGFDLGRVKTAVEKVSLVPGRCERINEGQEFEVIVDFAHNPDGLRSILTYSPKKKDTKRIVVFGCEGGKDQTKRKVMGEIAANLSDFAIITMDNHYAENPLEVAQQIEDGFLKYGKANGKDYIINLDRNEAIKTAISIAQAGDQVIIAGKGHESTQTIYDQIRPFCDHTVAACILQERCGIPVTQINSEKGVYL